MTINQPPLSLQHNGTPHGSRANTPLGVGVLTRDDPGNGHQAQAEPRPNEPSPGGPAPAVPAPAVPAHAEPAPVEPTPVEPPTSTDLPDLDDLPDLPDRAVAADAGRLARSTASTGSSSTVGATLSRENDTLVGVGVRRRGARPMLLIRVRGGASAPSADSPGGDAMLDGATAE